MTAKKHTISKRFKQLYKHIPHRLLVLVPAVLFTVVMTVILARSFAASGTATLYTSPGGTQSTTRGSNFAVDVRISTPNNVPVTGAVVYMAYPSDKLQVASIDYSGSAYTTQIVETNSGGVLRMDRAAFPTVISGGDKLFARVTFKSLATGSAPISFTNDSKVFSGEDDSNILTVKNGVNYNINAPPANPPAPQPQPPAAPPPSPPPGGSTTRPPSSSPPPASNTRPPSSPPRSSNPPSSRPASPGSPPASQPSASTNPLPTDPATVDPDLSYEDVDREDEALALADSSSSDDLFGDSTQQPLFSSLLLKIGSGLAALALIAFAIFLLAAKKRAHPAAYSSNGAGSVHIVAPPPAAPHAPSSIVSPGSAAPPPVYPSTPIAQSTGVNLQQPPTSTLAPGAIVGPDGQFIPNQQVQPQMQPPAQQPQQVVQPQVVQPTNPPASAPAAPPADSAGVVHSPPKT